MTKYSVLLLYPDNEPETYFDHVDAPNYAAAVKQAQEHAVKANGSEYDPKDFEPLLVLHGFHDSLI